MTAKLPGEMQGQLTQEEDDINVTFLAFNFIFKYLIDRINYQLKEKY